MVEEGQLEKVAIAFTTVAIGVAFLVTMLIVLTLMPDCRFNMPHDMLSVFSIQFAVILVLLLVNTITLSYTLAAEDNTFINETVTDSPGYLAVFCLTVITTLQLYLSIRRVIEYAHPDLGKKLPTRTMCFAILLSSFLIAAKRFVNIMFDKRTLNYRVDGLRWVYNQPSSEENYFISAGVGFALFFLVALYVAACVMICLRCAKKEIAKTEKKELYKDLVWMCLCLVMDLLFALLLLYSHYVAVPSRYIHVPIQPKFYAGLIQSFLLPFWPVVATFFGEDSLRQALRFRTGILMTGTPPLSPTVPRRTLVRQSRQHSLPIFLHRPSSLDKSDPEG